MIRITRGQGRSRAALLGGLMLAGWAGAACGPRLVPPAPLSGSGAASACAPGEGVLPRDARADVLAGEFRLALTAAHGAQAGRSVSGTLRLIPFGSRPVPVPAGDGVRYPLFGGTDVAAAEVGAVVPGDATAADPARPGVLVMEWTQTTAPGDGRQVMLRLGTDANHGDRLRFDGAFTALSVRSISADGFRGTWESGGGDLVRAGGHFCAERIGHRG